jgi:hypothetical protein
MWGKKMKKGIIFGILFVLLVGLVNAITITPSSTVVTVPENVTANVTLTTDYAANFSRSPASGSFSAPTANVSTTNFTWNIGFDSSNVNRAYNITFTAINSTNSADNSSTIVTFVFTNVNRAPTANAGSDQTVVANTLVTLNGAASSDPDSDSLTYAWSVISGSATLSNSTAVSPTFTPTSAGDRVFKLTVSDGSLSSEDFVTVTVNANATPTNQSGNLSFNSIKVTVGGRTSSNLADDSEPADIGKDASPGDKVTFTVKVDNNNEDEKMEDVSMSIVSDDEIGEDTWDDETDSVDISSGSSKTFKLEFEVPLKVEEKDYDITVEITGSENGATRRITKELTLTVDKETHNIKIMEANLGSETLSCTRTTELNIDILNLGSESEEEIKITAKSSALGLDYSEYDDGDIELGVDLDDDAEYSVSVPINAKNVGLGAYDIDVKVYRDTDKQEDSKTVTLTVEECKPTTPAPTTPTEPTETGTQVTVTPPATTTAGTQPAAQPAVVAVEEATLLGSNVTLVLLGLGVIILFVLIVWVIVLLVKK